ncbi:MAG: hypothetical protein AAGG56_15830 [Pseudomonadota bacterium]
MIAYLIALALVVAFTVNVVLGAVSDAPFVGNVGEMLTLFGASIAFSVGVLQSEARANSEKNEN